MQWQGVAKTSTNGRMVGGKDGTSRHARQTEEFAGAMSMAQHTRRSNSGSFIRSQSMGDKAFYSLDCNDGIENAAIGWAQPSPEDHLIEKEELAEYEELIRRLYEAISSLPPMQARRVHARYMLGMKVKDIAAMEGITPSQAGKSIHAALRRLRRYFARQKWTVNL